MSGSKTATVREVQHRLSALLERVAGGEEITVTRRGTVIVRIVPPRLRRVGVKWPDSAARMKRLFPDGLPPGRPASEIIDDLRGERV